MERAANPTVRAGGKIHLVLPSPLPSPYEWRGRVSHRKTGTKPDIFPYGVITI